MQAVVGVVQEQAVERVGDRPGHVEEQELDLGRAIGQGAEQLVERQPGVLVAGLGVAGQEEDGVVADGDGGGQV